MSVGTSKVVFEPAVVALDDATSHPPFVYQLSYDDARKVLNDLQAKPVEKLPIDEEWVTVPSPYGDARVLLIKPQGSQGSLPAIVYMHGGGWVLGNAGTHDRLVRELAVGANAVLAFVDYPNSPEARYPVAIEQGYATAQWIARDGAGKGIDTSRIAVAGESVGGDMTAALCLMAKERGDVQFVHAGMYYPVTDAAMDTASYEEFADGPWLTRKAMEWFWDAYIADPADRLVITASPIRPRSIRSRASRRPCCSSTRATRGPDIPGHRRRAQTRPPPVTDPRGGQGGRTRQRGSRRHDPAARRARLAGAAGEPGEVWRS